MESSVTFSDLMALFGAMVVLAAIPSVSVLTVTSRSVSLGFVHGAFTAIGVVAGDLLFILLALFGLALLTEATGSLFFLVKYLGGAYLVWLGIGLWRRRGAARVKDKDANGSSSLKSSFLTGLLITLGDQKAVVFYLGFLPAFIDLSAMSLFDIGAVMVIMALAVGGVKLGYAYAADRAGVLFGSGAGEKLNGLASCVMVTVGAFILVKP